MKHKICEKCGAEYAPYVTGPKEDVVSFFRVISFDDTLEIKGVCQFDNPLSKLYKKV